jgi:hypothetical protein
LKRRGEEEKRRRGEEERRRGGEEETNQSVATGAALRGSESIPSIQSISSM